MMINEHGIKILASLTGIVWLPFQAKYERYYKYIRMRMPEPDFAPPISLKLPSPVESDTPPESQVETP